MNYSKILYQDFLKSDIDNYIYEFKKTNKIDVTCHVKNENDLRKPFIYDPKIKKLLIVDDDKLIKNNKFINMFILKRPFNIYIIMIIKEAPPKIITTYIN